MKVEEKNESLDIKLMWDKIERKGIKREDENLREKSSINNNSYIQFNII